MNITNKIKIAIYPGTFDPITYGHVHIIERAIRLFDQIIIAVAEGHHKIPLIPLETRVHLARDIFKGWTTVHVKPMPGLLVDFAREHCASCIIRGLRTATDFDYESQLASMNYRINPELHTIFLPGLGENATVSATLVREIVRLGGDVSRFVPSVVVEYFQYGA